MTAPGFKAAIAMRGPAGPAGIAVPLLGIDKNSFVQGEVSQVDWDMVYASDRVKCRPNATAITNPADGVLYTNSVHFNRDGAAAGRGYKATRFVAPHTGTATATVYARRNPLGTAGTIALALASSTGTVLAHATLALTTTPTALTTSFAVVAGTEYQVILACNDAGGLGTTTQAQALVSRVQVSISGGSFLFAGAFVRLQARPGLLWNNAEKTPIDRGWLLSSCTRFVVETDAATMAVEYFSTVPSVPLFDNLGVLVGAPGDSVGEPWAAVAPTTQNVVECSAQIALPAYLKTVHVVSSPLQNAVPAQGTYTRAVYVPATALLRIVPQPSGRCLVGYGDSILVGSIINSGGVREVSALRSWAQLLAKRYPGRVAIEGSASLRLVNYGYLWVAGVEQNDSARLALRRDFVERMASFRPTEILTEIGYNDFSFGGTKADFKSEYSAMLDELHAACPGCHIWAQGIVHSPLETTGNTSGATMADFRAAISEAASTRAPWCTYINGLSILASDGSDQGDATHPTTDGSAKYAEFIATTLGI